MNVIIDYHAGNLFNLKNALDFLEVPSRITSDVDIVRNAKRILFPGVGAFGPAMENLFKTKLIHIIREKVASGTPFLGICLGMQLLYEFGLENGTHSGLGLLKGKVIRFQHELKIPQMGWNQIKIQRQDPIFQNIPDNSNFYFVHSYHAQPADPAQILGLTRYGIDFPAIVREKNVWGVQFHPEKSQNAGLQILRNFCSF